MREHKVKRLTVSELLKFRDAYRVGAACRACPAYNRTWACPPFDYDVAQRLSQYSTATVVMTVISDEEGTAEALLQSAREHLHPRLLEWEKRYGGLALISLGACRLCGAEPCCRPQPCRHPELLRPSPESWGLDLVKLAAEVFHIPVLWNTTRRLTFIALHLR